MLCEIVRALGSFEPWLLVDAKSTKSCDGSFGIHYMNIATTREAFAFKFSFYLNKQMIKGHHYNNILIVESMPTRSYGHHCATTDMAFISLSY